MVRHSLTWLSFAGLLVLVAAGCPNPARTAPEFRLSIAGTVSIQAGTTAMVTVIAERTNGHAADITLTLASNAEGISATGSIVGGSVSGTLLVSVDESATPTTHSLNVDGTDAVLDRTTTLSVAVVAPFVIATASPLAIASVGASYGLDLAATGGAQPYTWNLVGGALPAGFVLSASGALDGTASSAGTADFTVQVSDGTGAVATQPMSLLVTDQELGPLAANGSFENGFTSWSQVGSGTNYTIVSDAASGSSAARVTNRGSLDHGPKQNVFSAPLAGAPGTPVTTRFWVKLDAPGMARCLAFVTASDSGQVSTQKFILAEAVVRTADIWTEVVGTATLTWTGTLTGASIEFSIGQPTENVYPGIFLDDLRIERDADADGLPDTDEPYRAVYNPDRDVDGLPDLWETEHESSGLLDPDVSDADNDADLDGYSNRQEYGAATDPLDEASQPGIPANPAASDDTRAIVRYLALLPSRASNRVLSGQHITGQTALGGLAGEFDANVQALYDETGKWPAILSMQYEGGDSAIGPVQANLVQPLALDWAATGGLLLIKFAPFDPWTLVASSAALGAQVDLVALLDPAAGDPADLATNTTANGRWLTWLDQTATALEWLKDSGVVVLWRPLSEMNNGSHWHSRQPRDAFIELWRHMYDYFTNTRGLDNLIWVYEGDAVAHQVVPADYYYPGDDVVDLMGHNLYSDTWTFAYDLNAVFRRYPKIYGFPQAGSGQTRDGTWDNRTIITGIQKRFPRASLFCAWNDFYTGGGVFTTRSILSQSFEQELLDDPRVVTREEVDWTGH